MDSARRGRAARFGQVSSDLVLNHPQSAQLAVPNSSLQGHHRLLPWPMADDASVHTGGTFNRQFRGFLSWH